MVVTFEWCRKVRFFKFHYAGLAIALFFGLLSYIFYASNMFFSDPAVFSLIARYIAENLSIPSGIPYVVINSSVSGYEYLPIGYPKLHFILISVPYVLAGESGLYIFSAIFSGAFTFCIYWMTSHLSNRAVGGLAAILVFLHPTIYRIYLTPIRFEQELLVFALLAIWYYIRFAESKGFRFACLSGLFVGLALGIKQTGFLLAFSLILSMFVYMYSIYDSSLPAKQLWYRLVKGHLVFIGVAIAVALPFLAEQILTNGTLDYVDTRFLFPFLKSKWQLYTENLEYLRPFYPALGGKEPLWDRMMKVFYYVYYFTELRYSTNVLRYMPAVLTGVGALYLARHGRKMLLVIGINILVWAIVAGTTGLTLMYFALLPVLVTILTCLGIFKGFQIISARVASHYADHKSIIANVCIAIVLITTLMCVMATPVNLESMVHLYNNRGGVEPSVPIGRDLAYKLAGEWARANTPADALFLSGRDAEVGYYFRRNAAWLNFGIESPLMSRILTACDSSTFVNLLKEYRVSYLVYDPHGTYVDRWPSPIVRMLRGPPFELVYNNSAGIEIYKVDYEGYRQPEISLGSPYNSSVGSDERIFRANALPIYAHPRERWTLTPEALFSNGWDYCYLTISVNKSADRDLDGYLDLPLSITIKGYMNASVSTRDEAMRTTDDAFVGPVNVTKRYDTVHLQIENAWYFPPSDPSFSTWALVSHTYVELLFIGEVRIESISISLG